MAWQKACQASWGVRLPVKKARRDWDNIVFSIFLCFISHPEQ